MDGVQLPQGHSHFEEVVYFLPFMGKPRTIAWVLGHTLGETAVSSQTANKRKKKNNINFEMSLY